MNLLLRMECEFEGRVNVCQKRIPEYERAPEEFKAFLVARAAEELRRKMESALDKYREQSDKSS